MLFILGANQALIVPALPIKRTTQGQTVDDEDEEVLLEKLKQLKLAEQVIEKALWIKQLKLAITESQKCLVELQQDQPLSTYKDISPLLAKTSAHTIPTTPLIQTKAPGAFPLAASTGSSSASSSIPAIRTSLVTPLDSLLAGYNPGAVPQVQVNNPDGSLTLPQVAQESRMFLKPAQLAKGKRILRIVDFDEIVSTVEDRTLSEIGATKLVVSYGPKKPKLESVTIAHWVIANTKIFHS